MSTEETKKPSKPQTFAEITEEHITAWKAEHPKVHLIEIALDDEDPESEQARFYAKPLKNSQQAALMEMAESKKVGTRGTMDSVFKMMVLGGDMKYIADDYPDAAIKNELMKLLGELMSKKKVSMKSV